MHTYTKRLPLILAGVITAVILLAVCFVINSRQPDLNIENTAVRSYLDTVTYREDDASVIEQYAPEGADRNDLPEGFKVPLNPADSSVRINVYGLKNSLHAADRRTLKADGSSGELILDNLYPDTYYIYTLKGQGLLPKIGWFRTTGRLRMLNVEGAHNVRDLGGLKTSGGGIIKYGKIFRGSELDGENEINITPRGIAALRNDAGIGFDQDLRMDKETDLDIYPGKKPITASALGRDIGYSRIPIEAYLKPLIKNESEEKYDLAKELYRDTFTNIFDCVQKDVPVYIHCWGGADRTGTVCFLLEGLLGVSGSDLAKDYEMTSFAQIFGIRSRDSDDFSALTEYIKSMEGETLSLQIESFFRDLGFTDADILSFRQAMTAPYKED